MTTSLSIIFVILVIANIALYIRNRQLKKQNNVTRENINKLEIELGKHK